MDMITVEQAAEIRDRAAVARNVLSFATGLDRRLVCSDCSKSESRGQRALSFMLMHHKCSIYIEYGEPTTTEDSEIPRPARILDALGVRETATVSDLAAVVDASTDTVRRDLEGPGGLVEQGAIEIAEQGKTGPGNGRRYRLVRA